MLDDDPWLLSQGLRTTAMLIAAAPVASGLPIVAASAVKALRAFVQALMPGTGPASRRRLWPLLLAADAVSSIAAILQGEARVGLGGLTLLPILMLALPWHCCNNYHQTICITVIYHHKLLVCEHDHQGVVRQHHSVPAWLPARTCGD